MLIEVDVGEVGVRRGIRWEFGAVLQNVVHDKEVVRVQV